VVNFVKKEIESGSKVVKKKNKESPNDKRGTGMGWRKRKKGMG